MEELGWILKGNIAVIDRNNDDTATQAGTFRFDTENRKINVSLWFSCIYLRDINIEILHSTFRRNFYCVNYFSIPYLQTMG